MDLEKIFRNLINADTIVIFIYLISGFNMPKDLMEIAEYVPAGIYETEFGLILALLIVVAYIISLVLLYRYVSYGKKVYVAVVVIGFILDLFGGAYIMTSISFSIGVILNMTNGAILTLLFFSPIKDKFVQK